MTAPTGTCWVRCGAGMARAVDEPLTLLVDRDGVWSLIDDLHEHPSEGVLGVAPTMAEGMERADDWASEQGYQRVQAEVDG